MAVKTITIDMEAYRLLAADKQGDESFSKVIKRNFRPTHTAEAMLAGLRGVTVSEAALKGVENVVHARRNSMATAPNFDFEKEPARVSRHRVLRRFAA